MPYRAPRLNDRFVARARAFSSATSVLVALVGTLALAGWVFDTEFLKGFGGAITMKANAAVALLLAGASTFLLRYTADNRTARRAGVALAAVTGTIGVATLSQHVAGWNLAIDQLLFAEEPGALATASPGRMGPPASAIFALAGFALVLLHVRRAVVVAQTAVLISGLIAILGITGYAYGVETLYGVARFTGIAAHTSVALLLLGASIFASTVDRGFAVILADEASGSHMARRLLVFAVAVPLLLGLIRLRLEDAGHFDVRFGVAALILAIMIILTVLIAQTASRLNRVDHERLAIEHRLRDRLHEIERMMEALPIAVFIATDRTAGEITGNRAAREFFGMSDGERNLSLSVPGALEQAGMRVFTHGVEVAPSELPVQRAAREGVAVHDFELDAVFDDGTVRHGLVTALPLLDDKGNPRGAVASLMDITARRAAEEEREALLLREQEARAEAESANRAKDEFLATVSHELRTPLNAILGWATMLRDHTVVDQATVERALATIERSCRTQAQLIEDLLDVSRIVAGKLVLDTKPVELTGVIKAAMDAVRPAADAKGMQLRLAVPAGASQVRGDPTRLQQIVWNLLSNAVKFSSNGGSIDIALTADGPRAAITVTDSGEGIEPEFLPFVFERFRQADGRKTRRFTGLGLGLSIARSLAEMHGGTIEATSAGRGHGARFTVRLPLLPEAEPAAALPVPQLIPDAPLPVLSSLEELRILAADGDPEVRAAVRLLLERHGSKQLISMIEALSESQRMGAIQS